jgi:hypothetical protein
MKLPRIGGGRYALAMRALAFVLLPAALLLGATARAGEPPTETVIPPLGGAVVSPPLPPGGAVPTPDAATPTPSPLSRETPPDDPTGGAWTTPTLLFIPAGAVPTWNVR